MLKDLPVAECEGILIPVAIRQDPQAVTHQEPRDERQLK
jgi:hypothetical protein